MTPLSAKSIMTPHMNEKIQNSAGKGAIKPEIRISETSDDDDFSEEEDSVMWERSTKNRDTR